MNNKEKNALIVRHLGYWTTDYFQNLEGIKSLAFALPNDGTRRRFIETLAGIQSKYHPFFCSAAEWAEAYGQTLKLW